MRLRVKAVICAALSLCLLWATTLQSQPARERSVWNYDGGVVLITNGSIPNGPCFRLRGRVNAPGFFDHLKRIDTDAGTTFRRGPETVTHFPDQVIVSFIVTDFYDQTCPPKEENTSPSRYLTRAMMSSLGLSFYWKHGVELRPVRGVETRYFSVDPALPTAVAQARELPEKLVWSYQFSVPSEGVPLSDSLVLVLRTPDDRIAARVAARL